MLHPAPAMLDEIPLSQPDISEDDIRMVVRALRSKRLSIGPMLVAFESALADRVGKRHAIACSSGTAGLHMALLALGVGPGDEVITSPFSFIATANSILYTGATPVFVDIDPASLNMNPEAVAAAITPRTKAILAVETFGNPTHMETYRAIAARHEIRLVEDACEGLGGSHRDRPIGAFGHVGVFAFYPNKQITTGEGGMVVTDDERLADICRSLRNQGRAGHAGGQVGSWLAHERLGFNYRMDEMSAALGLSQLQRLDEVLALRHTVARRYIERFMTHPDLILPTIDDHTLMSWFVFVVRLSDQYGREDRDRIIASLHRHEIGAAPYFPCIHLQPFYRERFGYGPGMFPIAERISDRTIALPFHNRLGERDQDIAAQTLELMISRENLRR